MNRKIVQTFCEHGHVYFSEALCIKGRVKYGSSRHDVDKIYDKCLYKNLMYFYMIKV